MPQTSLAPALELPPLSLREQEGLRTRIREGSFDAFADTLARVGNCAHPIRLFGHSHTINPATGEILSTYNSDTQPLGLTYIACGNRRASVCPACARTYARDTFEMIRSGVTGGKTVPASVGGNPLVFATLTAPSFGHVHGIRSKGPCKPGRPGLCSHGRPLTCHRAHDPGDECLGQPLCAQCYDYTTHAVWQWWAPELWRRFTITLRRQLAALLGVAASRLNELATVQYAKVAEYQARAAIHFHALIRVDGPKHAGGYAHAPASITAEVLAQAIQTAGRAVSYTAPPASENDPPRILRFGAQLDTKTVHASNRPDHDGQDLSAAQVAGYLAKYATKTASDDIDLTNSHCRRLRATLSSIPTDADSPYRLVSKWVQMLGFRGHFSTKSRVWSITLTKLRRARRRYSRLKQQDDARLAHLDTADLEALLLADHDIETTLIVGNWTYQGTGWTSPGDETLALAAAAHAREHQRTTTPLSYPPSPTKG